MKRTLLALSLLLSGPVMAEGIEISCDGSPPQAVLAAPKPADRFLHVLCTKFGHVLSPAAGWFWTKPATFIPLFYPAQMAQKDPEETGNKVYFKTITTTALSGKAAHEQWALLAEIIPKDVPPDKALEVMAENNSGGRHTIYIFPNAWGYSCSPTCRKENAFIMVSQNKEHPQW